MSNQEPRTLVEHFSSIPHPRIDRCKLHKLIDILVIATCATICGAETWEEFELFGESKRSGLKSFSNSQTASLLTTLSVVSSLALTLSSFRNAFLNGFVQPTKSRKGRSWPLTVSSRVALVTCKQARAQSIWSVLGPVKTDSCLGK